MTTDNALSVPESEIADASTRKFYFSFPFLPALFHSDLFGTRTLQQQPSSNLLPDSLFVIGVKIGQGKHSIFYIMRRLLFSKRLIRIIRPHRTCLTSEINLLPRFHASLLNLNNMSSFSYSRLFSSWFSKPPNLSLSVDNDQSSK